jgi:hypothetical protein
MLKLKIDRSKDKVGVNEVEGLLAAMKKVMEPVQSALQENIYWSDVEMTEAEYTGRDGFIPYSDNCGGVIISEVIPECESLNFDFLEFGESEEEDEENDGQLDAALRIWLKFEGFDGGVMKFYLVMSGGNQDAPYFRLKYQPVIFETDFTAKSISGFKLRAAAAISSLIDFLNGKNKLSGCNNVTAHKDPEPKL